MKKIIIYYFKIILNFFFNKIFVFWKERMRRRGRGRERETERYHHILLSLSKNIELLFE